MKVEKTNYVSPATLVIHVRTVGLICDSRYMKFGSSNTSGDIDDENVVYGGSF